jgi:threonylcarbamoyladenosine tRNA methylthiotransferase MtaB
MPGVEWVVGNSHKTSIPDVVTGVTSQILTGDIFATTDILTAPVADAGAPDNHAGAAGDRNRPNLKIQDGCHNRCSFCIIPFVRGKSRYLSAGEVISRVRSLAANYTEVVLSGINLGRWGREAGSTVRLADLLRRILAETTLQRIRLSSVEPMDFSDDLLGLMAAEPRIAKHVHAPLQSGSDAILRKMHRKYRPRHYADRLAKTRAWMPNAAIGADVMVGFPGETADLFEESRAFIAAMPFTYLHVFTYSERPGTPAAGMPGAVPMPVRKERNRVLRELAAAKNSAFRESLLGRELTAVTLDDGAAITDNYLKAQLDLPHAPNRLIRLRPRALTAEGIRADLLPE